MSPTSTDDHGETMSDLAIEKPVLARLDHGSRLALPRNWLGVALLVPSLVFLGLFTYWPLAQVVWQSVHEETRGRQTFVGSRNFAVVFGDPAFQQALANNLVYAIGTVVPSLVLALALALVLKHSTPFNAFLRSLFFLPVLVPLVAVASLFLFIFLPGVGLIDHYLAKLGIQGANWIGDPEIALASIIGLTIWKNAGYYMLFFLAGLQAIPAEAYEQATIDGASVLQRLRYVTLPYLRPTIAFVFVIALLNVVTQVDHIFVLTKGGPSDSTNLLLFYVYQQAVERYDIGKAAAATIVSLSILIAISSLSLRQIEFGPEEERR
jgi:sn-glycerol 3-phosphate transport system permease protein